MELELGIIFARNSNGQSIAIKITNRVNLLKYDVLPKPYPKCETFCFLNLRKVTSSNGAHLSAFLPSHKIFILALGCSGQLRGRSGRAPRALRGTAAARAGGRAGGGTAAPGLGADGRARWRGRCGPRRRPFVSARGQESSHFLPASCGKWI